MEQQKKILLIEDEPEFRQAVRLRLEANGYAVLEAEDGAVGLELAGKESPSLIILDVMLPKMDGFQVARQLKLDARCRNIPVLMLTVMSQESDQQTGRAAGADAYLTKPFQPQELIAMVAALIAR